MKIKLLVIILLIGFCYKNAEAQLFLNSSNAVGPAINFDGNGLNVEFVRVSSNISNVTDAYNVLEKDSGDIDFIDRVLMTTPLIDFTDDSPSQEQKFPYNYPFPFDQSAVFAGRFYGFYNQISPGERQFFVTSDDGFQLKIGGLLAGDFDGLRPAGQSTQMNVIFQDPGLYPIELIYFENGGGASVEFSYREFAIVPTNELFTNNPNAVPEPATIFLWGNGLLGMYLRRRSYLKNKTKS